MTLTGWIIYNGFLTSDKFIDYANMLQSAAEQRGHHVTIYRNNDIINNLTKPFSTMPTDTLPDYVIFADKDIYLAQTIENLHIPVFNSAKAIELSDDKIKTYQRLAQQNIRIPKTIIAPKTFGISQQFGQHFLNQVIDQLSFPFILKEAFGSFGEQVFLIKNEQQLHDTLKNVTEPFMFQQYIATSYGRDLRIQVVGEEVVAAMKRTSDNDFRANVTSGGHMVPHHPTRQEIELAVQASLAIGTDFSGVDLLFGEDDTPIVCEVNSNAHIRNLLDCTHINVAPHIIKHIEKKVMK